MIMCPAVIFANKRIINANGGEHASSTGSMSNFTGIGTPGNQKICCQ